MSNVTLSKKQREELLKALLGRFLQRRGILLCSHGIPWIAQGVSLD
jgi:hypothetical protein